MLNAVIGFAVKNKLIIALFVLALIGYGSYQFTRLPIDAVPDITNNQVQVITVAPSFGANDIERLVTFPVEQANSNIPGLKEIRSFSRFGLSLVTIVFEDDIDVYWARQQVTERLQTLQSVIPSSIGTPELGPVTTGLGEIYQYVIRPQKGYEHKYDATELRTIQDWIVRRQLLGVKGVAEVSSFGGNLKQYSIEVDPARLASHHISINDVFKALEENNGNTGGAYIEKGATVLFIRSEGLVGSIEDIKNIAIKSLDGGTPLFIRDVAEIRTGHATRYGAMTYNDEGEVAGAVVMMLKGANSSEVIRNVKERVEQISKTLPEGVIIEPFLDRSKMVNNAIGTVRTNLLEGALIVVFVLVIFLGNIRAGLVVASVIPLSMLFAVIMMNLFGVSGNLMSLGALDFGLIVDGAVIIVEAVMHQLARYKSNGNGYINQSQMDTEVRRSAGRMMKSAVFGQIIILIVYLPIFTLQGIEGKMFKPMAQTVAFALMGAFILSLTYVPMMSAVFLGKKISSTPNYADRLMSAIEVRYQYMLQRVLRIPRILLLVTVILFGLSLFTLSRMGGEFIPALEEGDFAVDTRVLTGSSLTTTIRYTQQAASVLKTRFPEVEKVVTKIGSGEVPTDPMPMEASDMMVILKPKKEWTSAGSFDELAAKMGKALEDVPGITAGFQYPVQMRFNELMTGARQDVVCKIFGENLDSLGFYADKLAAVINTVQGAENLYVESVSGMPQIIISYNRNLLAQYNLSVAEVNKIVNASLAGQTTGMVFEEEKRFQLVVRLAGEQKKNLQDIQNLLVPAAGGRQIPLYQLADVQIKEGPNQIQREDAKRRIIVGFNVRGRDVQSIVEELRTRTEQRIGFSPGYYVTYGGAFENLDAAKSRLMVAVPAALLLIFLLLFFAFGSVKHSLLIYSAIPLSAIGGIFFLALRGLPFSISAGIGFIALFGVAVLNGIVLIAEFNRLKQEGETDLHQIVLKGTRLRLRPVLMTAMVASLGFLPMALSNGAGAEVQRPLATVVIGGLLVATLLTLFVLPILYIFFEKGINMKRTTSRFPALLLPVLLLGSGSLIAQTPISLQAAIDTALLNNLSVKQEKLTAAYREVLIRTGTDLAPLNLVAEAGQINSAYTDTRFGISQAFDFPVVYKRQKALRREEWNSALLNLALRESLLAKEVTEVFYHILYLKQKQQLLTYTDSLYKAFLQRAGFRLQQGEADILEKAAAESQLAQVRMQMEELVADLEILQWRFQWLLNTNTHVEPAETGIKLALTNPSVSSTAIHPRIVLLEQQKTLASAALKWERSRLLPGLLLGYNNASIQGTGADNKVYGTDTRFHTMQLGLGLPLFAGAQKARIRGSRLNEQIAENNYELGIRQLQAEGRISFSQYEKYRKRVAYYEESGLNNAALIINTAGRQLTAGNINYLQWVQLVHQAVLIRNDYTEAVKNMNEAAIQFNYLNNK